MYLNFFRKTEKEKQANRSALCRVCLKSMKTDDFCRTCFECQRKVCEDCASYTTADDNEEMVSDEWFLKYFICEILFLN